MSDIFISYSKADWLAVEQLAAYLELEGWSVWSDRSLAPGDPYRDEIMRQLAQARAMISVWTPASVKSDWVRAEAGRAKAGRKADSGEDLRLVLQRHSAALRRNAHGVFGKSRRTR